MYEQDVSVTVANLSSSIELPLLLVICLRPSFVYFFRKFSSSKTSPNINRNNHWRINAMKHISGDSACHPAWLKRYCITVHMLSNILKIWGICQGKTYPFRYHYFIEYIRLSKIINLLFITQISKCIQTDIIDDKHWVKFFVNCHCNI